MYPNRNIISGFQRSVNSIPATVRESHVTKNAPNFLAHAELIYYQVSCVPFCYAIASDSARPSNRAEI